MGTPTFVVKPTSGRVPIDKYQGIREMIQIGNVDSAGEARSLILWAIRFLLLFGSFHFSSTSITTPHIALI